MVLKVRKEVPAPPQSEAKVKEWRVKQAVLKGIHRHKKKSHFQKLKSSWLQMQPNILSRMPLGEISLTTVPNTSPPLTPAQSRKEDRRQHICVSCGCESNTLWIKPAVKKLYDTDVAVNPLIGPDEKKKVYVLPASEYDDLDVTNTVWII